MAQCSAEQFMVFKRLIQRISLLNKINKTSIHISQRQTGESGTEVLISIPI
jgi:hypothetical protein